MENEKRLTLEDFKLNKLASEEEIAKLVAGAAAATCHLTYPPGTACYTDCD
jgi:hypothetical protein